MRIPLSFFLTATALISFLHLLDQSNLLFHSPYYLSKCCHQLVKTLFRLYFIGSRWSRAATTTSAITWANSSHHLCLLLLYSPRCHWLSRNVSAPTEISTVDTHQSLMSPWHHLPAIIYPDSHDMISTTHIYIFFCWFSWRYIA